MTDSDKNYGLEYINCEKKDIQFITAKFTSYPGTDPNPDCHEVEGDVGICLAH